MQNFCSKIKKGMKRRAPGKPYWQALANYPKHKEEIDALPRECDIIFALYPYENGKYLMEEEEFYMELVVHCTEAKVAIGGTILERVRKQLKLTFISRNKKSASSTIHIASYTWISAMAGVSVLP